MAEIRWIDRDSSGKVCGHYACKQRDGQESLPEDDAELVDFQARVENPDLSLGFEDFVIAQVKKLDATVLAFVYEHYPQHRQITLSKLLTDARLASKTEAVTYLEQCDTWIKTVFAAYYQLEDAITTVARNDALTISERQAQIIGIATSARATVLDPLGGTDPAITIRHALELLST